ncbi:MAG: hypothetical protein ABJ327_14950 [Litoreibacter sp.]
MSFIRLFRSKVSSMLPKTYDLIRDESGSAVELVLVVPALFTIYAGSFIFFDAARTDTLAMKATYTVSDILSREEEVDEDFLDGLKDMMDFLLPSARATGTTRVSLITYNDDHASGNDYRLIWSYPSEDATIDKLTQDDLDFDSSWIPVMGDDESVVVTESYVNYTPFFDIGWGTSQMLTNIMITRPRFAPTLTKIDEPPGDVGNDDIDNEGSEEEVSDT